MKRFGSTLLVCIVFSFVLEAQPGRVPTVRTGVPLDSIVLSDPFILADKKTNLYYMTGTGGMLWKSPDLKLWQGPYPVTQTDPNSWMGPKPMVWAAEIHPYRGKYYYFATFTNRKVKIDTVQGHVIERRLFEVDVSGDRLVVGKRYVP